MSQSSGSRLWKFLLCGAGFLLLGYFGVYAWQAFRYIAYPYTIDLGGEGFVLNCAYQLAQGHHLYHDISTYPFVVANYPPVYPLIYAPFIRLFGVSFAVGRAISFVSFLLIGFLVYRIVREITKDKAAAIVSSLFLFPALYVCGGTNLARVDALGLLFSFTGVCLVFRSENSKMVYAAILFFLLAFYTKQSFVAAPIASFAFLFLRDRRLAVKSLTVFVGSLAFTFLLANYLTGGQFYLHTVKYNLLPFGFSRALAMYLTLIAMDAVLFGFVSYYMFRSLSGKGAALSFLRTRSGLFAMYFIASALTALSAGKIGSAMSYFWELLAVSCILFGICLGQLRPRLEKSRVALGIVTIALGLQLLLFLPYHAGYGATVTAFELDIAGGQEVSGYVRNAQGEVLCQDAGLALLNGKEVAIGPLDNLAYLSRRGEWAQSGFLEYLKEQRFSVVVPYSDLGSDSALAGNMYFTREMVQAIRENYHLVDETATFYVYEPNP